MLGARRASAAAHLWCAAVASAGAAATDNIAAVVVAAASSPAAGNQVLGHQSDDGDSLGFSTRRRWQQLISGLLEEGWQEVDALKEG